MRNRLLAQRRRTGLLAAASVLLAACGGADQPATETAEPTSPKPAANEASATADGTALTPEYLEGTWCYAYIDLGKGNREEQGIEYVFSPDGGLTYQRASTTDKMDTGSYEINGDMIDLRPMFMVFDLRIDSVAPDEFVLKGMGRHHFIRGACPE